MDFIKSKLWTAICLLFITGQIAQLKAQEEDDVPDLAPPTEVQQSYFPQGQTLTQDTAIIIWIGPKEATAYDVVLFKTENRELILHEEIENIHKETAKFEYLEPSTNYEVLVRSVRVNLDGTTVRSKHSTPFKFRTLDSCVGGMIHSPCNAHCIGTCVKPKAVCDRRCVSGCACPRGEFLHNGECLTKTECKTAGAPLTEVLAKPEDLKVHKMKGSNDVLFTWAEVEGADFYTVTVVLRDGTVVQKLDKIKSPFVIILGLKPKTPYRFRVVAKYIKFEKARRLGLGNEPKPFPPKISQVTENSFYVTWLKFPPAVSYKIVIYDPEKDGEMIIVFRGLTEKYVTIQGLTPGTTYDVSLIAITVMGTEPESVTTTVKTLGKKPDDKGENAVDYFFEPTTTPTTPPPTTKPRISTCEERKTALEAFYKNYPGAKEPIPECADDGNYRSTQCPNKCYCVNRRTGDKRPGSDFDNPKSQYALDCHKYGRFKIEPMVVIASAQDTRHMKVRWERVDNAKFYIVVVYEGFSSTVVKNISGITRNNVIIDGLNRGEPYVVTVLAVDSAGITSTDKVKGVFITMPYLDPPKGVRLLQLDESKMKATWEKNEEALHYLVQIFGEGSKEPIMTYENVTEDHVIFDVEGRDTYRLRIKSTGVTSIPGSGREIAVSSNHVDTVRKPAICIPRPIDIIYAVDASRKVSDEDYPKSKEFFAELTKSLGPLSRSMKDQTGTRVAVVKSSDVSRTLFRYDGYDSMISLVSAINYIRRTKSTQMKVGKMLEYIHNTFFTSVNDDDQRPKVLTAVVTFVGSSSDDNNFALHAAKLRGKTNVISVGVDGRVGKYDMSLTSPKDMRVIIPSYDDIDVAVEKVMEILCNLK